MKNLDLGKNENSSKGITLVALIVTIIVLLILAGVTIATLTGDNGLLTKSETAVRTNRDAQIEEKIKLEVIGSYNHDGKLEVETVKTNILNNIKEVSEIDKDEFPLLIKTVYDKEFVLNEKGELNKRAWTNENNGYITDGITSLKIGDYVKYEHTKNSTQETIIGDESRYISYSETNANEFLNNGRTNGGTTNCNFSLSSYTKGWQVLGVEEGKLKLISEDIVGQLTLKGEKGYIFGNEELTAISSIYGHGNGAALARSINAEDINSITGYNPLKTGTGDVRAKGTMWEYNNVVTYFWKNNKLCCTSRNEKSGSSNNTVFRYFDVNQKKFIDLEKDKEIEIISKSYNYYPRTLTESKSGATKGLETTSPEYKLLFLSNYWLNSKYVGTGEGVVGYGILQINNGRVYDDNLCGFGSWEGSLTFGVRPVIILLNNACIIKDNTNDGTTKEKACLISN